MQPTVISRLAPTPSGYLHLGNAFNFILTYCLVYQQAGRLRLRIDDIDTPRADSKFIQDIFVSLKWFGITWHDGPQNFEMHESNFKQTLRFQRYQELLSQLISTGHVFACTCSRAEIAAHQACGCKHNAHDLNTPDAALKIDTSVAPLINLSDTIMGDVEIDLQQTIPDFVIRRRDGLPAYQLVSLADDLLYQTNTVVRGLDLLPSTAAQIWLADLLGYKEFAQIHWYHHGLFYDEHGDKLSKTAGSVSLQSLRADDPTAEKFYHRLSSVFACDQVNSLRQLAIKVNLNTIHGKKKLIWPIG